MICMFTLDMGEEGEAVDGVTEPTESRVEHLNPEELYVVPSDCFTMTFALDDEVH